MEVVPSEGQIDHLIGEINRVTAKGDKVLVTTLTKKMAEQLTDYLAGVGIRVRYLHSEVDTLERMEIIRDLRMDRFDVLVGINLLREGLDLPEVALVAILDADKEGFLRNETSLMQTVGRAARNVNGHVIMYADEISPAMKKTIDETGRRRRIQDRYNRENGITPKTVEKSVRAVIEATKAAEEVSGYEARDPSEMTEKELREYTGHLEKEMRKAADDLQFERAAELRDRLFRCRENLQRAPAGHK